MRRRTKIALYILAAAVYLLTGWYAFSGDTYDCINTKGDYINYGPAASAANPYEVIAHIVVAHDSARSEPRWQAMLDDSDMRNLIYIHEYNSTGGLIIRQRP